MFKKNHPHHPFIAVAGILASGKTTATRMLGEHFGATVLEENAAANVFLPWFYEDAKRWALHSQLFYLVRKIRQ